MRAGVVFAPGDFFRAVLGCQFWQDGCGVALGNDEVTAAVAVPLAQTVERVQHERDPGRAGVVKNVPVEDEHRDNGVGRGRRGEAGVVRRPEVTAMPVQAHT